jgi:hypothetical protein
MSESRANSVIESESDSRMERLLDDLGWATLLIVTGVFWLIPGWRVPSGSWLIAVGAIILVFTIARLINRYRVSEFALSAGAIALIAGIGSILRLSLPVFPIALIVIGCRVILVRHIDHRSELSVTKDPLCCK